MFAKVLVIGLDEVLIMTLNLACDKLWRRIIAATDYARMLHSGAVLKATERCTALRSRGPQYVSYLLDSYNKLASDSETLGYLTQPHLYGLRKVHKSKLSILLLWCPSLGSLLQRVGFVNLNCIVLLEPICQEVWKIVTPLYASWKQFVLKVRLIRFGF